MTQKRRIYIICPVVKKFDAISDESIETCNALVRQGFNVTVVTSHISEEVCKNIDGDILHVSNVVDFACVSYKLHGSICIWEFGIYNELHDVFHLLKQKTKSVVRWHNITPAKYGGDDYTIVHKNSFEQICSLSDADEIWHDSPENYKQLSEWVDFDKSRQFVIPILKEEITPITPSSNEVIDVLYIGRFVKAKGVDTIISRLIPEVRDDVRFTFVSALAFSDSDLLAWAKTKLEGTQHRILNDVSEFEKAQLLWEASILVNPSKHEGFSVPTLEGLRSECLIAGFAAGNMPNIYGGFGKLAAPGSLAHLMITLDDLIDFCRRSDRVVHADNGLSHSSLGLYREEYLSHFGHLSVQQKMVNRLEKLHA